MTAFPAVRHRHAASLLHPTGRHAAHGRVLLARWARHALVVLLHLVHGYRPRHMLREAFGADLTYAAELADIGTAAPLYGGDALVLRLADPPAELLAVTEVPNLAVSLAHRRRAAWTRWAPRRQEQP